MNKVCVVCEHQFETKTKAKACSDCYAGYRKASNAEGKRRAYRAEPEKFRMRTRLWNRTNPEKKRAWDRQQVGRNRERCREQNRKSYLRYREQRIAAHRKWTAANPEKRRSYSRNAHRRRQLRRALWQLHSLEIFIKGDQAK